MSGLAGSYSYIFPVFPTVFPVSAYIFPVLFTGWLAGLLVNSYI